MAFFGRKDDLFFLERCYQAAKAQLVVLYGRRRVGKTECLRQFAQKKHCVWYSCSKETDALQLKGFSRRVLEHDHEAARYLDSFASWEDAFRALSRVNPDSRTLVVIDEFPYAVEGNPAIPSALQNAWDTLLSTANVMIVLCGSSLAFMESELLSEKNPLYGRATGVWKMEPLGYNEACLFFPEYTPQQQLEAYGILGGVPHYLQQFDPQASIAQNVCDNILARGCPLYTEAEFLLRQELREPAVYNAVLWAVASGETSLNGIAQKTLLDTRTTSTYLRKLQELRIVGREFSVQDGQTEQAKQTRGLWRVSDNFIAFWYAAAQPYVSELDAGAAVGVWNHVIAPRMNALLSASFEDVCRQWLRRRNLAGELPFFYQSMGRWWHKADEIDAVALGADDAHLLAECKFKNTSVDPSVLAELADKEARWFKRGQGWRWLFSKEGFADDGSWARGQAGVRLVDAAELSQ